MKFFLHISFLLFVFSSVYTMEDITRDIFNDHRDNFKDSIGSLYWQLQIKNKISDRLLRLRYSELEVKFSVILDRYFAQESNYQEFIDSFTFNDVNHTYVNLVLQELETNDEINELAAINVFRQHLKLCCGKRVEENVLVEELCTIANDSEQMSYDVYMTRMTLNLFIRYWLKQQNLI